MTKLHIKLPCLHRGHTFISSSLTEKSILSALYQDILLCLDKVVMPPGIEPGISTLKGWRVRQFHYGIIWCPMNDAQLIHYTFLTQSPGASERFSGLMGRLNFNKQILNCYN